MAIVPFQLRTLEGIETTDTVLGWPTLRVDIEIGFIAPADGVSFVPNFKRHIALIDTGSNFTTVHEGLTAGLTPLRTEVAQNFAGQHNSNIFRALLSIPGLGAPITLEVGTSQSRYAVVLGRDVLEQCEMIYSPLRNTFTLERP